MLKNVKILHIVPFLSVVELMAHILEVKGNGLFMNYATHIGGRGYMLLYASPKHVSKNKNHGLVVKRGLKVCQKCGTLFKDDP